MHQKNNNKVCFAKKQNISLQPQNMIAGWSGLRLGRGFLALSSKPLIKTYCGVVLP